ncbi:MAG: DUF6056 family protein, partial [Dermatophilaceae bacterium]
ASSARRPCLVHGAEPASHATGYSLGRVTDVTRPGTNLPVSQSDDAVLLAWLVGIWGAHLAYWLLVFRSWLVQGDDYLNAAMAGRPDARTSWSQWWLGYWTDVTSVNGRATDALVRLLMAPGPWCWRLLGPVLFTVVAMLLWWWAVRGRLSSANGSDRASRRAVVALAALGATWVLVALAVCPPLGGDVLFWMSSTVSYVVPTALTVAVGMRLSAHVRGERTRRGQCVATGAAIMAAHLLHEVSSFTTVALVGATWLLAGSGARDRRLRAWTVTSIVGFALQMLAPGFWARFSTFRAGGSEPSASPVARGLDMIGHGVLTWYAVCGPILVVLLALWLPRLVHAVREGRADGWASPQGTSARDSGDIILALAGVFGASALPILLGLGTVRAFLPAAIWLMAAVFVTLGSILLPARSGQLGAPNAGVVARGIAVAAAAAAFVVSAPMAVAVASDMSANAERWAPTAAQLEQARRGERRDVHMPAGFPYPEYLYARAFDQRTYEQFMRVYYGLPDGVTLHWPAR